MKIVVVGGGEDGRGAALAGAAVCRTLGEALADPEAGLIFSREPHADPRVVLLPEGGSDAAAGQRRGGGRRGA